jgi:hypothetical protein
MVYLDTQVSYPNQSRHRGGSFGNRGTTLRNQREINVSKSARKIVARYRIAPARKGQGHDISFYARKVDCG